MIWPCAYERLIAWRYLRSKRRDGFVSIITAFSMIGIMLGVATLILVTSLMNGIREEMTSRFIGIDGHISIYGNGNALSLQDTFVTDVVDGVAEVTTHSQKITGQVMATHQQQAVGAQVMAQPDYQHWPLLNDAMGEDVVGGLLAGDGVVLGYRLAEKLRVEVGDSVTLISPQGRATVAGFIPRMKAYTVIGTINLGMHLFDSSLILMPFADAGIYFQYAQEGIQTSYEKLDILLNHATRAQDVAAHIAAKLGPDYRVYDWQRSNAGVFSALLVQRNVMVVILTLIILVAAFNIISSLIMLVKDKGRDIAVLRTFGVTRGAIIRIFCLCGVYIGIVGTVVGVGLGILLADNIERIRRFVEVVTGQELLVGEIYFLSTLPTQTDSGEVMVIAVTSLMLCFLASCYPAWRAARIRPAEALRYE